jgi:hypothetical protein
MVELINPEISSALSAFEGGNTLLFREEEDGMVFWMTVEELSEGKHRYFYVQWTPENYPGYSQGFLDMTREQMEAHLYHLVVIGTYVKMGIISELRRTNIIYGQEKNDARYK